MITSAWAQTAETAAAVAGGGSGNVLSMLAQFALIILIVYFLLIRPQQKRMKQHEASLNAIVKGSRVIVGGIVGTVVAVKDDQKLEVEVAPGVKVVVMRALVSQVVTDNAP